MMSNYLKILLANGKLSNQDSKNKIAKLFVSVLTVFAASSMGVAFFVTLALALAPIQYCGLGIFAIIYVVLHCLSRRMSLSAMSITGLLVSMAAAVVFQLLFPGNEFFFVFVMMIPVYAVCAMKTKPALLTSILAVTIHSVVYSLKVGIDNIMILIYVVISLLSFFLVSLAIEYVNSLIEESDNEAKNNEAKVKKKQEFISKLSHRIRTPLSNILGITNILADNVDSGKKQLIDSLIASVKTITDIVELIDEEAAGVAVVRDKTDDDEEVTTFDLQQLITNTGEFTQNFEVKLEVYSQLPLLKGKAVKIRRIFLDIFDFFLRNTPQDKMPVNVIIAVNRVRIPINPIKYRFDIKSNVAMEEPSSESSELAIAQRLIEELNGNIKRRFEDDMTCIYFNICFDGEEKQPAPSASVPVAEKVVSNETKGFSSPVKEKALEDVSVIVCDDNPINQKVMSLSLDKYVKSITLASNGQECISLLQKGSYDIVLMDIQMPVLDGYSATKKIRAGEQESGSHIPIIAVTANTLAGDRQHCLSVGMDDYVSKPFHLDDVLEKMKSLVAKYPQGR